MTYQDNTLHLICVSILTTCFLDNALKSLRKIKCKSLIVQNTWTIKSILH